MSTEVKTQSQLYEIYKNEVLAQASELTDFSDGSLHDIIAGAISMGMNELSELIVAEFMKTYFKTAKGADLEALAIDHFGESFKRPLASEATGEVTFSRPDTDEGDVIIALGTIVKTLKDANGVEIRFKTTQAKTLTTTEINVPVEAVIGGTEGNVNLGKIVVIESTLSDPTIIVTNEANTAGGVNTLNDAEYLEYIQQKILALAGATEAAVKGAAKSVEGVSMAEIVVEERTVIEWDIASSSPVEGAVFFRIPQPKIYIADASGNSSQALIDAVRAAIAPVKAAGVRFDVLGAFPIAIDWTAGLTLNPAGPNYAELSVDLIKIRESMQDYINKIIAIGGTFNKVAANTYMLDTWGPDGTGDLTDFETTVPAGNVAVGINQKLIAGTMSIA